MISSPGTSVKTRKHLTFFKKRKGAFLGLLKEIL
jgi:hypothetical protein